MLLHTEKMWITQPYTVPTLEAKHAEPAPKRHLLEVRPHCLNLYVLQNVFEQEPRSS